MTGHIAGTPIEETALSLMPLAALATALAIARARDLARSIARPRAGHHPKGGHGHRNA